MYRSRSCAHLQKFGYSFNFTSTATFSRSISNDIHLFTENRSHTVRNLCLQTNEIRKQTAILKLSDMFPHFYVFVDRNAGTHLCWIGVTTTNRRISNAIRRCTEAKLAYCQFRINKKLTTFRLWWLGRYVCWTASSLLHTCFLRLRFFDEVFFRQGCFLFCLCSSVIWFHCCSAHTCTLLCCRTDISVR